MGPAWGHIVGQPQHMTSHCGGGGRGEMLEFGALLSQNVSDLISYQEAKKESTIHNRDGLCMQSELQWFKFGQIQAPMLSAVAN